MSALPRSGACADRPHRATGAPGRRVTGVLLEKGKSGDRPDGGCFVRTGTVIVRARVESVRAGDMSIRGGPGTSAQEGGPASVPPVA